MWASLAVFIKVSFHSVVFLFEACTENALEIFMSELFTKSATTIALGKKAKGEWTGSKHCMCA